MKRIKLKRYRHSAFYRTNYIRDGAYISLCSSGLASFWEGIPVEGDDSFITMVVSEKPSPQCYKVKLIPQPLNCTWKGIISMPDDEEGQEWSVSIIDYVAWNARAMFGNTFYVSVEL